MSHSVAAQSQHTQPGRSRSTPRTGSLSGVRLQPRNSHSQVSMLITHPSSLHARIHVHHDFLKQTEGKTMRSSFANKQRSVLPRSSRVCLSSSPDFPAVSIPLLLPGAPPLSSSWGLAAPHQTVPSARCVLAMRQQSDTGHGSWMLYALGSASLSSPH